MTIHRSGRNVTTAEATNKAASIKVLLPNKGVLEAVEAVSVDQWIRHNIWLQTGNIANGVALFIENEVLDHSGWSGRVKLEKNLYLVANFTGALTAAVRIALHYKVAET